ncbi:MAG TPA: sulfatase-like hydrolase/transferase, partial [Tepidisphaeraceae bacterium]|nr:sulfatase-like hydrolase/transferase [Tepidisphaeraceae bacterium]
DLEAPFFLHVGTVAPHPPLLPPACYYQRYDRPGLRPPVVGDWVDTPGCPLENPPHLAPPLSAQDGRFILREPQRQSTLAGYYGLINHFDDQLQLLLARLASEQQLANTYVIFTSDHGEMLGDHHCFRKALPYQGSVRIPFFISGPSIAPRQMIDRPIVLMDILPTCCELAGVEIPKTVEGQSLVPVLSGAPAGERVVHGTHSEMAGLHGGFHYLTDGRWKYIWWTRDGQEQLFDLTNDPGELHDLVGNPRESERLALWRARLLEHIRDAPEGFVHNGRLVSGLRYSSSNRNAKLDA